MMASEYAPSNAYDLPSEVASGKNITISHGNMQFKTRIDNRIVVPKVSLIGQYHGILSKYIVEKEYTDKEFSHYYQRPKLLSLDLYGTPELWSWLLYINNCKSVANFTNPKLKIFTSDIGTAIREILTITSQDMAKNRAEVYPDE